MLSATMLITRPWNCQSIPSFPLIGAIMQARMGHGPLLTIQAARYINFRCRFVAMLACITLTIKTATEAFLIWSRNKLPCGLLFLPLAFMEFPEESLILPLGRLRQTAPPLLISQRFPRTATVLGIQPLLIKHACTTT